MFRSKPTDGTLLEKTIADLHAELRSLNGDDPEYGKIADQIVKLETLQANLGPKRVSPDTLVLAATNILGIALILEYEHARVVTSKALSFVKTLR